MSKYKYLHQIVITLNGESLGFTVTTDIHSNNKILSLSKDIIPTILSGRSIMPEWAAKINAGEYRIVSYHLFLV